MSELLADMSDWTLEAIVRGSNSDQVCHPETNGHDQFLDDHVHHQPFDFPSIFEVSNGSNEELEELYKPFYTTNNNNNSELPPSRTVIDFEHHSMAENKQVVAARVTPASSGYTPKYKRRKNQHKRVVMHVSAEGLASDMWAWRKYGQKPIKGSPYPRSYYRCSSSKGCLARKQVEQSFTDEGMFIVTYTAEHSHSQPTRRNSLAGTVRQKFPSNQSNKIVNEAKPPTILVPEKIEELQVDSCHARIKEEENRGDDLMSDFFYNDDFFTGFKDFDEQGFGSELPVDDAAGYDNYETQQQQYHVMSNCSSWF